MIQAIGWLDFTCKNKSKIKNFFFLFTSILQSILALRILSKFLWRGLVTWTIIYNKLINLLIYYK